MEMDTCEPFDVMVSDYCMAWSGSPTHLLPQWTGEPLHDHPQHHRHHHYDYDLWVGGDSGGPCGEVERVKLL